MKENDLMFNIDWIRRASKTKMIIAKLFGKKLILVDYAKSDNDSLTLIPIKYASYRLLGKIYLEKID